MVRPRPLPRLLRLLVVAAVLVAFPAQARDARVVVIDVDPRIVSALVVALSPWSLEVVRAPGPSPASDLDSASARASAIASEWHAGAVVWLAPPRPPDDKASLWVYDAQTMQLAVRPLTQAEPLDDAGAAAVALSVKTVLRTSPLAASEPPTEAPPGSIDKPPVLVPLASLPPSPRPAWRVETVLGARAPTGTGTEVEPRGALGVSFWPTAFSEHAGFGLAIQGGPGVSVETRSFQGEMREATLALTARLRTQASRWLAFEVQGGPGVLLSALDGQVLPTNVHVHALRLDPSLDFGGVLDMTPSSRVGVGLLFGGSALLRFQRYSLDGAPLLNGPAVTGLGGLRLSVEFD
jgi:hypothetical protein